MGGNNLYVYYYFILNCENLTKSFNFSNFRNLSLWQGKSLMILIVIQCELMHRINLSIYGVSVKQVRV